MNVFIHLNNKGQECKTGTGGKRRVNREVKGD
jgi:hypothetical protein